MDAAGEWPAGEEITMEFRITAGKQFECRAYLSAVPDQPFERSVGNPLVNTVNPGRVRLQIEEAEEELRRKKGGVRKTATRSCSLPSGTRT